MREWGTSGLSTGDLLRLDDGPFEHRLGHTWARGRLKQGDLIVAVQHAGDHFFNFLLLEQRIGSQDMTLEAIGKPFGAYVMGRIVGGISKEEVEALLAGDEITIPVPEAFPTPEMKKGTEVEFTTFKELGDAIRAMPDAALYSKVDLFDDSGHSSPGGTLHVDLHGRKAVVTPNS
jgi:hypothetical protein